MIWYTCHINQSFKMSEKTLLAYEILFLLRKVRNFERRNCVLNSFFFFQIRRRGHPLCCSQTSPPCSPSPTIQIRSPRSLCPPIISKKCNKLFISISILICFFYLSSIFASSHRFLQILANSCRFLQILADSCWFLQIFADSCGFLQILADSSRSSKCWCLLPLTEQIRHKITILGEEAILLRYSEIQ